MDQNKPSRREKRQMRQLSEDISSVLATPAGKRVFAWLLSLTGLNAPSFSRDSERMTSYAEGRRAVGLGIVTQMGVIGPMVYPNLLRDVASQEAARLDEGNDDDDE